MSKNHIRAYGIFPYFLKTDWWRTNWFKMVKSVVCYESSCISDDTFRLIMEGWEGVRRRLGLGEEEGMYNVFSKYSRNYSLIYIQCVPQNGFRILRINCLWNYTLYIYPSVRKQLISLIRSIPTPFRGTHCRLKRCL